ncbi:hypothetical protein KPH14_012073 [Odynerus spinipes]|uniref:Uncharacterized protein n=1 Tax=Odynerus spinipes TaxID=1348599 RepID=A0AAD9R9P1_9HYME|nr:hypothetical protein KPH14_012073 [Odynerus spinipes]
MKARFVWNTHAHHRNAQDLISLNGERTHFSVHARDPLLFGERARYGRPLWFDRGEVLGGGRAHGRAQPLPMGTYISTATELAC